MSKVSVQLVTFNGAKYLPYLFASLEKQTYKNFTLHILDNASSDNTVAIVENELKKTDLSYTFKKNSENLGFGGGHNLVFFETDEEYAICLNQDMYLEPDCIEKMVNFLESRPEAASVAPRLMRWDFASLGAKKLEETFTDRVDSLGLKIFKNRRVIDRYNQYNWSKIVKNFFTSELEVFGVSGALPIYRRSAVVSVSGLFDPNFHSYKEDVDLAYRLQNAGYKSYIILDAVAYHDRSAAGAKELGDKAAAINKAKQSDYIRYYSYKNHLIMLYKNERWQNLALDFPWILCYEVKKFVYLLLFYPAVLKGLYALWVERKRLKELRCKNNGFRKISWMQFRHWFRV